MKSTDMKITHKKESEYKGRQRNLFAVIAFGLVACALYGVGAAIRGNIGILLNPLSMQSGVPYEGVSFCIALMNLTFGAVQPLFGILASRSSNRFVLTLGSFLLVLSMFGMMHAHSYGMLILSLGILFGFGAGALAFGMVLTSAIHFVGQKYAMMMSGMLNAAAGMVSFIFAPMIQSLLTIGGMKMTLITLALIGILMVPVTLFVTSRDPDKSFWLKTDLAGSDKDMSGNVEEEGETGGFAVFRLAFHNQTFRLLVAGFSTCGFHMVIIESHLFSQYVSYGIDGGQASWAFSFYGIATIFGALLSGYLSTRLHKGHLLGFYYGFRAVWAALYIFLIPKTILTAFIFSIGLGLTGDATVSPTSGLVNRDFRLGQVATLIGFLFLCHQIGAFASAWLGGLLLEATGGYQTLWLIDIGLCTFASVMSLRINPGSPHHRVP